MKREFKFVLVSGLGFIFDFIIYNILTYLFGIDVDISNIISSFLGITFVFFTSTKKIFATNTKKIPLKYKYFIYLIYEFILIIAISYIMVYLKDILSEFEFINEYVRGWVKILVTPFTLLINYIVMIFLTKW